VKNLILLSLLILSNISLARDYEDFDKRGRTGYVRADGKAFEWVSTGGNSGYHREIVFEKKNVVVSQDYKSEITTIRPKNEIVLFQEEPTQSKSLGEKKVKTIVYQDKPSKSKSLGKNNDEKVIVIQQSDFTATEQLIKSFDTTRLKAHLAMFTDPKLNEKHPDISNVDRDSTIKMITNEIEYRESLEENKNQSASK
jgi:hypothetical protein